MQRGILTIADRGGFIPDGGAAICPGIHFCPDWDGLPICEDSPEWDACTCPTPPKGDSHE